MLNRRLTMVFIGLMLLATTGCCGGRGAGALAAAIPDEVEDGSYAAPAQAPTTAKRQLRR